MPVTLDRILGHYEYGIIARQQVRWSITIGQEQPFVQGWFSCEYGKMEPNSTLYFTTPKPARSYRFETGITLRDEE